MDYLMSHLSEAIALAVIFVYGGFWLLTFVAKNKKISEEFKSFFIIVSIVAIILGIGIGWAVVKPYSEVKPYESSIEKSAEIIVRDYYRYIDMEEYDKAYALLSTGLQENPIFKRPGWDEYVSKNTFIITGDVDVKEKGNVYKVQLNLVVTPDAGVEESEIWTFCVVNYPDDEIWLIRDIYDKPEECWKYN